jgi:peptidoglycan hydrolase CwlO-like protein
MVLVTGSWKLWLAGLAASLAIFGVVYFTVIQPDQNTANQAVKTGLQQSQQAISQAQKQFNNASGQVGSTSGQASSASAQTNQTLSKAQKLTACLSAAGTDTGKIQVCQTKFTP